MAEGVKKKTGNYMKTKKKAMTMAEVLVCLAIVGILTMLLIPIISKTTQNKEKFLYKKAMNTMQNAVSAVMNENGVVNSSNFWPDLSDNGGDLQKAIGSKMILMGGYGAGTSSDDPTFRSNDGMIWWDLPKQWPAGEDHIDITVDVNGEGGRNIATAADGDGNVVNPDRLKIRLMKDGRVIVPMYDDSSDTDYDWSFEREYLLSQDLKNVTTDQNDLSGDSKRIRQN